MVYTLQYRSTAFYTVQYTAVDLPVDLTCTSARRAPYPAANHDDRPHRGGGTPSSIIIGATPPPEPAATNPFLPRRQAR